jgi:hypothetical protein
MPPKLITSTLAYLRVVGGDLDITPKSLQSSNGNRNSMGSSRTFIGRPMYERGNCPDSRQSHIQTRRLSESGDRHRERCYRTSLTSGHRTQGWNTSRTTAWYSHTDQGMCFAMPSNSVYLTSQKNIATATPDLDTIAGSLALVGTRLRRNALVVDLLLDAGMLDILCVEKTRPDPPTYISC